jgi:phage shock protein C
LLVKETLMKKLYRSRDNRMIWGVCGGLAKYFAIDPVIVRVLAVVSIFISGLGILAYIILAIAVPVEG